MPVRPGDISGARLVSVGCTWSSRAKRVAVPTAAAPSILGAAVPAGPIPRILWYGQLRGVGAHGGRGRRAGASDGDVVKVVEAVVHAGAVGMVDCAALGHTRAGGNSSDRDTKGAGR